MKCDASSRRIRFPAHGLPYMVLGGVGPLCKVQIKDSAAFLRLHQFSLSLHHACMVPRITLWRLYVARRRVRKEPSEHTFAEAL